MKLPENMDNPKEYSLSVSMNFTVEVGRIGGFFEVRWLFEERKQYKHGRFGKHPPMADAAHSIPAGSDRSRAVPSEEVVLT